MGLKTKIRWSVILAVAMSLPLGAACAADAPVVRFAACPTCTAEGVEALIIKQTNIP